MKIRPFLALAAAAASPARADMIAVYASPGGKGEAMRVEIADGGRYRIAYGDEGLFLLIRREGHTYFVLGGGDDRIIADVDDLRTATRESMTKNGAPMCEAFRKLPAEMKLVQRGTSVVAGRSGDAWFRLNSDGTTPAKPDLVISHDPALAPLGAAIAEEYRASSGMMPDCPAFNDAMAPVLAALATGTPIAMPGLELDSVQTAAIDPHRFELPGPPRTAEELRKAGKGGRPPITVDIRPKP